MKNLINIATVNFRPVWGRKQENLSRILEETENAVKNGVDLIVFPEMALTGYDDEPEKQPEDKMQRREAETVPGPSSLAVAELTQRHGIYAVFGLPERDGGMVYNAVCACGPDGIIGTYRKIHVPYPEMYWAGRGDKPFIFDTPWGPVGVSVCYDTYCYPEMSRYYAAKGCRIQLNCSAFAKYHGDYIAKASLEISVATSRNFIVTANLTGKDIVNEFWGGSSIIGPGSMRFSYEYYAGRPMSDPRGMEEAVYTAEVDLGMVNRTIYEPNRKIGGATDYRPSLYRAMMDDLLQEPKYRKTEFE